ncbi:MAG: Na/Pi cotransporter family protein [Planctomycetes bacterium]|nr:Na/Pi cotransporter family protein [Planctomycetota bacterium]
MSRRSRQCPTNGDSRSRSMIATAGISSPRTTPRDARAMILTLTQCIGGLGIFFAGMYLLTENLRLLTGRRFREAVARFTRSRPAAVAWGVSAGAVMQSTPAVTLITVSMLGSGLIAVETGLAMVLGCNVGTSLLVVVASLDIKILVYLLLGLAGLSFASTRLAAARTVPLIVFGIGLVFLGLDLLKDAVGPIAQQPWLRDLLASSGSSMPLLFLVGIVLSVLTQSANSIMLLAIALADAGALSFNQAVITIYGANVGDSMLTWVLSLPLRGRQRQVAMFQVAFNSIAACVMLPLLAVELVGGVPLVLALARQITVDPPLQLACLSVMFNMGGAFTLYPCIPAAARLLARRYPPPTEEGDAAPQFIYAEAAAEPDSGLDLAALEQRRLVSLLPRLLAIARDQPADAPARLRQRRESIAQLSSAIGEFLERLGERSLQPSAYERLHAASSKAELIDGIADTIAELASAASVSGRHDAAKRLSSSIVEGIDAMLLTAVEAMGPDGGEELVVLQTISGNRSTLMRRIREDYLAREVGLSTGDRRDILTMTIASERACWLLHRFADALLAEARIEGGLGALPKSHADSIRS